MRNLLSLGLAGIIVIAGCNSVRTNTLDIEGGKREWRDSSYSKDAIMIDGRAYVALDVPEGKTARIGGMCLDRSLILDSYLVPYSESKEIITRDKAILSPIKEKYVLANVTYDKEKKQLLLNTGRRLQTTRVLLDDSNVEEVTRGTGHVISLKTRVDLKDTLTATLEEKKLYFIEIKDPRARAGEEIQSIKRLYGLFLEKTSVPVTAITRTKGKTTVESGIQGIQYVPILIEEFIDIPKPEPKQEKIEKSAEAIGTREPETQ